MKKEDFQSIAFALVLLALVFIGKKTSDHKNTVVLPANSTTPLAEVLNAIPQKKSEAIPAPVSPPPAPPMNVKSESAIKPVSAPQPREITVNPAPKKVLAVKPETQARPEPKPITTATAALVKEVGSPFSLYEKDPGLVWPIASLTKLMTALVAQERIAADTRIPITPEAVATLGESGNLNVGEVFTSEDLVKAMLTVSSNDAAVAISQFYGMNDFLSLMRAKAIEIGMLHTTFDDPTGLSPLNRSTTEDFASLAAYILKGRPEIFAVSASPFVTITEVQTGIIRELVNINRFAGSPHFMGGKTGYTTEANGNLLSIFREHDRDFLLIVFGTDDRFSETQKLYSWLKAHL